jgi:recombinational DNA repair protein RecR
MLLDHLNEDDIKISSLIKRLKYDNINELIIATDIDFNGETRTFYNIEFI